MFSLQIRQIHNTVIAPAMDRAAFALCDSKPVLWQPSLNGNNIERGYQNTSQVPEDVDI